MAHAQLAIVADERERRGQIRTQALRDGRFGELVRQAGARYAECDETNFYCTNSRQEDVLDCVRQYISELPYVITLRQGMVLYGPCGTGKDHLAFAICRHAIADHDMTVSWLNAQEWFGDLRDGMSDDRPERELIAQFCGSHILVVSDPLPPFGALTQYQAIMLYRLINIRYNRGRVTIATLNVADDREAKERLGVPTWDRLCDGAWKVHCYWPSYRKPAREIK